MSELTGPEGFLLVPADGHARPIRFDAFARLVAADAVPAMLNAFVAAGKLEAGEWVKQERGRGWGTYTVIAWEGCDQPGRHGHRPESPQPVWERCWCLEPAWRLPR